MRCSRTASAVSALPAVRRRWPVFFTRHIKLLLSPIRPASLHPRSRARRVPAKRPSGFASPVDSRYAAMTRPTDVCGLGARATAPILVAGSGQASARAARGSSAVEEKTAWLLKRSSWRSTAKLKNGQRVRSITVTATATAMATGPPTTMGTSPLSSSMGVMVGMTRSPDTSDRRLSESAAL